jgi:hypothetical protein
MEGVGVTTGRSVTSVTSVTRQNPLSQMLAHHGLPTEPASDIPQPQSPQAPPPTEMTSAMPPRPTLPVGVRLFFEAEEDAKVCWPRKPRHWTCWPEEAHHWTFEGAPRWYYTREYPVPPLEPALAPHARRRCPGCSGSVLAVTWQDCGEEGKRVRVTCQRCGRYVAWLKRQPNNPDLWWRATP